MEIQYLKEFIQLAEIESYADAAEKMYISQSSLFKHIKMLENELGVSLFEKKGKHIKLGEYGQIFLSYALQIVELDNNCKKKIQSKLEIREQRIRIWTNYHLGDLAVAFHTQHEEYLMDIRHGEFYPKQVNNVVESRTFDLYFLCDISEVMDSLICMPYVHERMVLAVNKEHPLANRECVTIQDIKDENFILFHDYGTADGKYNPHNNFFTEAGFVPKSNIKVERGPEIVNLVQKNFGVAILSGRILDKKAHDNIAIIELEPKYNYSVWCCYHKDKELSHGAELLIDFCRKQDTNE